MAVNYSTTVKNARLTAVRDAIDGGTGAGKLQIFNAAYASKLAEIDLADPCGTVASGVLTLSGFPRSDTSADATGTAALARLVDSSGTTVADGLTVGTSGSDINLGTTAINAGNTVTINSAAITHA